MMRNALIVVCSALALQAQAQGVPVVDTRAVQLEASKLASRVEDIALQENKLVGRDRIRQYEEQQLQTIDEILAAFEGVSSYDGTFMVGDSANGVAPLEDVYGPLANPAGHHLFGDARETIEQIIIRGAADTYHLAGVGAAGLSRVQWRCLLQALIKQESAFQIGARSPAAAFGLTQIIPSTAQYLGVYPGYYEDPYLQVTGGARYLAEQLQNFGGNIIHALAAYNAGPGAVTKYGGVPPYSETQGYVARIPRFYNEYLAKVGGADALGTIDPAYYALAEYSYVGNSSIYYGQYQIATAREALLRVRALITRISGTSDPKDAYDLNTMMKAEATLIASELLKLRAARTIPLSADQQARMAEMRLAEAFMADMTPARISIPSTTIPSGG